MPRRRRGDGSLWLRRKRASFHGRGSYFFGQPPTDSSSDDDEVTRSSTGEGDARFAAIDRAVGREGRKIVFLLRLSPVFPFNLLNYALGLTQVRLVDYVIASLGMLPGTLLYVHLGAVGADLAAGASRGWEEWSLLGVGLAATLTVTVVLTRAARARMEGADATPSP